MTKKEVIQTLNGDPDKLVDPCVRSDVIRNGNEISNNGDNCLIESTGLGNSPDDDLILQLHLPQELNASRYAANETLFERRGMEPYIEMRGVGSDVYNTQYMGRILAAETLGDEFVLTTENGCIRSPDVLP